PAKAVPDMPNAPAIASATRDLDLMATPPVSNQTESRGASAASVRLTGRRSREFFGAVEDSSGVASKRQAHPRDGGIVLLRIDDEPERVREREHALVDRQDVPGHDGEAPCPRDLDQAQHEVLTEAVPLHAV